MKLRTGINSRKLSFCVALTSIILIFNACAPATIPAPTPTALRSTPISIITTAPIFDKTSTRSPETATPSAQPSLTSTVPACTDVIQIVLDLYDEQSKPAGVMVVPVGEQLSRGWRVQNAGDCVWDSSYTVRFEESDSSTWVNLTPTQPLEMVVKPGDMTDIWVQAQAPMAPGQSQARWVLTNGRGDAVGEPMVWQVEAVGIPTTTAEPRAWIRAVPDTIQPGSQVAISWTVVDAKEVYFFRLGQAWQEHPVESTASRFEYPERTTTYELRIVNGDDTVEVKRVTVRVDNFDPPRILTFIVEPKKSVVAGQCVEFFWETENRVTRIGILVNHTELIWVEDLDDGVLRYCPKVGRNVFELIAVGPGGEDRAIQTLVVGG